jgi:hypothetical protein
MTKYDICDGEYPVMVEVCTGMFPDISSAVEYIEHHDLMPQTVVPDASLQCVRMYDAKTHGYPP